MRTLIGLGAVLLLTACPIGGGPSLAPDFSAFDLSGMNLAWAPTIPSPPKEEAKEIAPSDIADKLKVGDVATVTTSWNGTYVFHVYRVSADSFGGLTSAQEKYKVMYSSITKLTVHRKQGALEYAWSYFISGIAGQTSASPAPQAVR